MQCPKCESTDVYLCSTVYEQGTSTATTKTKMSGSSQGLGQQTGQFAVQHSGEATQRTVTQTKFAAMAAPPETVILQMLAALGGVIVIYGLIYALLDLIDSLPVPEWITLVAGLLALLFAVVLVFQIVGYPKHRRALAKWRRTWICGRCGTKFVPQ